MPFQCDIVTQERSVYSGQVDYVSLPGTEGRMGVLPKHSATLTALSFGEVMVRTGEEEEFFAVGGGYAEIQPNKVVILADSAEQADEIDLERAEAARERAREVMEAGVPEDPARYAQIQAALHRAQIRIDVQMRRGHGRRRSRLPTSLAADEEDQL